MKKIAILGPGNNVHTANVANSFHRIGYEVHVLSLHGFRNDYYNEIKQFSIKIPTPLGYVFSSFLISSYLKKNGIGLINAHYATGYGLLGALVKCKIKVLSVWGSDVYLFPNKSWWHKTLLENVLERYERIFSTSHDMAEVTRAYTDKKIYITPFAVGDIFLKTRVKNKSKNTILTIGSTKNFDEKYGVDILIKVYAKLISISSIKTKLVLIGDGKEMYSLKKLANDLNIEHLVDFVGRVEHAQMIELLDKFDLYAIFSRSESFGVSALEASARGVPVVSSNVGGLPEVVCNDVTGEVLDTNNLDSMALSLSNLLNNEDKRAFLSKNGPGFVENNYSSLVMDKAFSVALDFSQNT
nr:glycosyltransferase [Vibrio splendidus]PMJ32656.1 hypothetical protein BCU26_09640 [Vibrio splendidus]